MYNPFVTHRGWTIQGKATGHEGPWRAALGPQVPAEIVAGFTDALTRPRSAHAPNVWAPLLEHRWRSDQGQHVTAVSPDGGAFLQFHQPSPGQGLWWASARTEQGQTWDATFTPTTPMHLIQAFATALADPTPVMRARGQVPPYSQIRTTSVSVRPHELAAWQQARLTSARTRPRARTSAMTTARAGKSTPAARPHTASGSALRRR